MNLLSVTKLNNYMTTEQLCTNLELSRKLVEAWLPYGRWVIYKGINKNVEWHSDDLEEFYKKVINKKI